MGFPRAHDKIVWCFLLQHQPHGTNVVRSVAPVPARLQIAQVEFLLDTVLDVGHGASDFACHKGLAAAWGLVVEQDAARRMETVTLPVVHRDVVAEDLGASVGAAGVESRGLALGRRRAAEHLAG